jgi:hypothetical protein
MTAEELRGARVMVPEHVLFQEVGEQAALLHLETEIYYSLDETGAEMWRVLERTGNADEALAALEAIFEVEPDRLSADFAELVGALVSHDLLRIEP